MCYFLDKDTEKIWTDARDDCKDKDGDLMTINSDEKQVRVSPQKEGIPWFNITAHVLHYRPSYSILLYRYVRKITQVQGVSTNYTFLNYFF